MCPFDPPADLVARRGEIVDLWHAHQKLRAEHEKLQGEVERLRLRLAKKTKQVRGNVSERRKPKTQASSPAKPPAPGHGPREQEHLEEREEVLTLDEADKVCTACGGELGAWDGQFEESIEIDVEERVYVKKRIKRQKYRCRCGACIETAPPPEKLIPGGTYSLAFAIEVAHDKYVGHEPLERQARRMRRAGLEVESQTLWDQLNALAYAYEPVYDQRQLFLPVDDNYFCRSSPGGCRS